MRASASNRMPPPPMMSRSRLRMYGRMSLRPSLRTGMACSTSCLRKVSAGSREITVFSRDPADTLRRHDVEHAIPVRRLGRNDILPYIRNLDLLIIGGGGILFDAEARIYLREAMLAQEVGVPFVIYAVGVGPLEHSSVREIV